MWTQSKVDDSYSQSAARGYTSFAAPRRDLDAVPSYPAVPMGVHSGDILTLADARNFLYLLDDSGFASRNAFLDALSATDYDLLIIDAFHDGTEPLTAADVARLRTKAGGGSRLVLAYMSIGEAEDYRYYWQNGWRAGSPGWLAAENPEWAGNYKVRYWDPEWQAVIYGDDDSYTHRLLTAGFDGVYLDIIDAFEYFEE